MLFKHGNFNVYFFLQNATSGTYKILGDQLRKEPQYLYRDNFEMVTNIVEHERAAPAVFKIISQKYLSIY